MGRLLETHVTLYINIGSGSDLLPCDTKPLYEAIEAMWTYHQ